MLGLAVKLPSEQRRDGAQNGLKVVELEAEEVGSEAEAQLDPPAGEAVPDPDPPPSTTHLLVPVKEDPSASGQADPHLTAQDMRRAKRIRVRLSPSPQYWMLCVSKQALESCFTGMLSLSLNTCFP